MGKTTKTIKIKLDLNNVDNIIEFIDNTINRIREETESLIERVNKEDKSIEELSDTICTIVTAKEAYENLSEIKSTILINKLKDTEISTFTNESYTDLFNLFESCEKTNVIEEDYESAANVVKIRNLFKDGRI